MLTSNRGRPTAPVARLFAAASVLALAGAAAPAYAAAAAPSTGDNVVTEVTVTARHRAESLQKVPVAVSVVTGAQAASKNLNDIQDISTIIPSVDFRTSASNKDRTVFVRGIGTISTSPGVEPSVSTVVDGVVFARAGQATVDLDDLDHIEVLNGPQGTLFGKNASAGVVSITTRNPGSVFAGYADASWYSGNEFRFAAGASGPIVEGKLNGLLSLFDGQYGGNVENLATGGKVNGYRHDGIRAKLVATPTDALTVTLSGDYTHSTDTTPNGVFVSTNQVAYPTGAVSTNPALAATLASEGVSPSADNRTVNTNVNTNVRDDNGGGSLTVDYALPEGYKLTSITAYRDWNNLQLQDYDQIATILSASKLATADFGRLSFHQTSEELRVASPKGKLVDFVGGLYFLDSVDHENYQRTDFALPLSAPVINVGDAKYGSKDLNYAVYGEADVNVTSAFRVILGARGVWDQLSFYENRVSTSAATLQGIKPAFAATGSTNATGWAGRAGLQYDVTSDVMAYFTASRGYMGPAYNVFFNMAALNTPPLKPETSDDYEIGVKSNLLDHRVQLDLVGFLTDFSNYQANSTQLVGGSPVTNLINAGSVTTRGVAVDAIAKPLSGLTLAANLLYDDAHVVNFNCPPGAALSCHINGEPLPFAPRWKTHLEGDYRFRVVDGYDGTVETDWNWQSSTQYQFGETPTTIQPSYGVWNASVGVVGVQNGWTARFLVKNLLNQHYSSYIANGNLGGVVRWVPRDNDTYYGLSLRKDF